MIKLNIQRKLKSFTIVMLGGVSTFSTINVYKGNDKFYREFVMPLVHRLDPERAHELAIFASKYRLVPKSHYEDPDSLKVNVFGKKLSNPIGLAAGFDKQAEAIVGLYDIGFGFVEVGSVTPFPQPGNDKPRVFRLSEDKAVIDRYGFNSVGHDKVHDRLNKFRSKDNLNYTIGVNLGKNKTSDDPINDYVQGIYKFGAVADYLVINVSSPNTPGLRKMQSKIVLTELLKAVVKARDNLPQTQKPYLLLKLAPDLSYEEREDIAEVVRMKSCSMDGLIISNSTVERPNYLKDHINKEEIGALSGSPLKDASTKMIFDMYKLTNGMTIIGVGGIFNGKDAYEKIKAGASVVQIYTGLIYEGPPIVAKIKRELVELLKTDGYHNIAEAVGRDVR